jgi:conjugal transfer pilus assembly protein TraU
MRKLLIYPLIFCLVFAGQPAWSADDTRSARCTGKFPNPLTDICWSCVLPIKFGNATLASDGQEDNGSSGGSLMCQCMESSSSDQEGKNRIGFMIGFWEPVRIMETVRQPYCFPTLAGSFIDFGISAIEHADSGDEMPSKTTFYQQHYYLNSILFWMDLMFSGYCMEKSSFDLAFLTEIDPLWEDDETSFILNPDVILFGNLFAQAVCVADCVASSFGFGRRELFWCAGCQGTIYPLTGWASGKYGLINTSALLTQRMMNRLHRTGLAKAGAGSDGKCGMYTQILMDKRNYKYQLIHPIPQTNKIGGKCCQPFGRSTVLMEMGKEFPYNGEDAAWQIFRKRDCCDGDIINWIL